MSQQALLGIDVTGQPHDALDRFYTPDSLAVVCVRRLRSLSTFSHVLEPSVGGGAFVRALRGVVPGVHVTGCDVDPGARFDLVDVGYEVDFVDFRPPVFYDAVVGNPPFSRAQEHVAAARRLSSMVGLILPMAILEGASGWGAFLDERPFAVCHPIEGRPWPKSVRGCGFFVWIQGITEQRIARKRIVKIAPGEWR